MSPLTTLLLIIYHFTTYYFTTYYSTTYHLPPYYLLLYYLTTYYLTTYYLYYLTTFTTLLLYYLLPLLLTPHPLPFQKLNQLANCLCPMRNLVFNVGTKFSKCFVVTIGNKQRVVAKARCSVAFRGDMSLNNAFKK